MKRVSQVFSNNMVAKCALPLLVLALTSCMAPPQSAFYNRGGPESLIDVSSEVVNLSVAGKAEIAELSNWIAGDAPSRAELFCDAAAPNCKDAQLALQKQGVEVNLTPSMNNTVTLVYERILARDCNQRAVDSRYKLYNVSPPSFGCSVAANLVQHVSDKREFVNPSLMDDAQARGAVAAYKRSQEFKEGMGNASQLTGGSS